MANIFEWTEDKKEAWDDWLKDRPQIIKDLANRFPPNKLYKLNSSGHRVLIYSYSEDGTLTVFVSGEYNMVAFERRVFGIKPEDLYECDFPTEDEPVGSYNMPIEEAKKLHSKLSQHERN